MAENKKSIIEQSLLDIQMMKESLNANTKDILRSVAREEFSNALRENINEAEFDEEDIDSESEEGADDEIATDDMATDDEVSTDVVSDVEGGETDLEGPSAEAEDSFNYDAEEGSEDDYTLDMTGASDDELISVFKKLGSDDGVEIVSDEEIVINDPNGGQYKIELNKGGATGGLDLESMGSDLDGDMGADMDATAEIGADMGTEMGSEMDADMGPEMGSDMGSEFDEEDELGEGVVFELAMGDDLDPLEEDIVRGKGHDKHVTNASMASGNIESTTAPVDSELGDNLEGGFKDGATKYANAEGPMVMNEEDIEEQIAVGMTQEVRAQGKGADIDIKGAGAEALKESKAKYQRLLAEARKLKVENDEFRSTLIQFRKHLGETALFTANLSNVTKLFMEHSTTTSEKQQIMERFDRTAKTIKESKELFRTVSSELNAKKPIKESFEGKINNGASTSSSSILKENTTYVDPSVARILELFKKQQ